MSTVHRILPAEYRRIMVNGVALPLVAGLTFARESHDAEPLLAAVVACAAVCMSVWLAHWAGWVSAPHVVLDSRAEFAMPRPSITGSHPRLAVVSVALLLLTGCPPLGETKPPPETAPEPADEGMDDEGDTTAASDR